MEAGADTQQSGETAVSESEAQQITLAQVHITHPHFKFTCLKLLNQRAAVLLRTLCNFADVSVKCMHVVAGVHSCGPGDVQ